MRANGLVLISHKIKNLTKHCAIVFVPCHNQQAIIRFDKLDIGAKIILKQGSLRDGAIMHVVIGIRNDEGDRRQGNEVSRKTRKGLVAGAGHIGEIHPRVVLARVSAGSADSGSG